MIACVRALPQKTRWPISVTAPTSATQGADAGRGGGAGVPHARGESQVDPFGDAPWLQRRLRDGVDDRFSLRLRRHCSVVQDWMYEGVTCLSVRPGGAQVRRRENPWALKGMAERLLEAIQRGMWEEPSEEMTQLLATHPGYRRAPRGSQRAGAHAMLTPHSFPFTAIVGQEPMKRALVLNAIYPAIGGILISSERGTKSPRCALAAYCQKSPWWPTARTPAIRRGPTKRV